MGTPNFYASHGLDRQARHRKDADWLRARLADPETRLLPVWRGRLLVDPAGPDMLSLSVAAAGDLIVQARAVVWLGEHRGAGHVALDLSHFPDPDAEPWHPPLIAADRGTATGAAPAAAGAFVDLRSVGPVMDRADSALLAYARGLAHWHGRHQFCGVCGHPTVSDEAGHLRRCSNHDCATPHFPRTDPAVIVLILDRRAGEAQRCLLARNATWRHMPGMRSTLAGFVEPGESLEDTVRREMAEEVGVRIGRIVYHSSQPWPFPASIMLGFHAIAETTDLVLEDGEIETAAWYTRDQVRNSPEDDTFKLPRKDSIAHRLIKDWVDGTVSI